MSSKVNIRFASGLLERIRELLLSEDDSRERFALIPAGHLRRGDELILLARQIVPLADEDYVRQGPAVLVTSQRASAQFMQMSDETGLHQIDVHTHPFSDNDVRFSGGDDHHEVELARYIHDRLPGIYYGSMVLGQRSQAARLWSRQQGSLEPVAADILPLDAPIPYQWGGGYQASGFHQRQVAAFGEQGQQAIGELRIGLVGYGGGGAEIAEQLVRLGVQHIVVVDHDHAELTNLNRVAGMTWADAVDQVPKVDIAERQLRAIRPDIDLQTLRSDVAEPEVLELLKTMDILIAATDNHASRLALNYLSCQYLIPLINAGVQIEVDEEGTITDCAGEVAVCLPGPGGFCLSCAGGLSLEIANMELAPSFMRAGFVEHGYLNGADVPSPAVVHLNSATVSLAVAQLHALVCGWKKLHPFLILDLLQDELLPVKVTAQPDCPFCGEESVLGWGDLLPLPDLLPQQGTLPDAAFLPEPDSCCDDESDPENYYAEFTIEMAG